MGFLSGLFTNYKTIVSSRICFDKILVNGEINVNPGCKDDAVIDWAIHILILCQISKMLYVVPRNYKFTKNFVSMYYEVCDEKCNLDSRRFKNALFNSSLKKHHYDAPSYIFSKLENETVVYESYVRVGSNKSFNFKTDIQIGAETGTALSTPLVLLEIVHQTGNLKLLHCIQSSVRLMCGKYLDGLNWTDLKNVNDFPHTIYAMTKNKTRTV